MSVYKVVLEDELIRVNNNLNYYLEEIEKLPKGSLLLKKINGINYWYLIYRNHGKVTTKYVCREDDLKKTEEIKRQIILRKEYLKSIKKLKASKTELDNLIRRLPNE